MGGSLRWIQGWEGDGGSLRWIQGREGDGGSLQWIQGWEGDGGSLRWIQGQVGPEVIFLGSLYGARVGQGADSEARRMGAGGTGTSTDPE